MAAAMKSGNGGLDAAANWLTLGTSERQLATPFPEIAISETWSNGNALCAGKPLQCVHEYVFGVLSLESELVDSRLKVVEKRSIVDLGLEPLA